MISQQIHFFIAQVLYFIFVTRLENVTQTAMAMGCAKKMVFALVLQVMEANIVRPIV
jgi:hypothetical protein